MPRLLPALLIALTLVSPSPDRHKVIEEVLYSTVKVESGTSTCTGIVVDAARGWVLTAEHCLGEGMKVDGVEAPVVKKSDMLAILQIEPMSKPRLELGSHPQVGDEVLSIGYGYGELHVFDRHASRVAEGHVVVDGPLSKGMSGGPMVNPQGKLIGINQMSNAEMGLGCGVEEIKDFLKRK